MIHSGAVIAAGVSQGRSTTFRCDLRVICAGIINVLYCSFVVFVTI